MYLFFDVEAAGKPKNWKAPSSDTFNWPRAIQLAWMMYDEKRELIEEENSIIKPEGFEITPELERYHGITMDMARSEGKPIKEVLQRFATVIDQAEYVIAHNMTFNAHVIEAEFHRASIANRLPQSDQYCLMQEATYFCKIKGKQGRYKWPSLTEVFTKTFKMAYENPGHADQDVRAVALSFFKLLDLEAIEIYD